MKRLLAIIMTFIIFIISLSCVNVSSQEKETTQIGFAIEFNCEAIDRSSIIINNTHYVPLRRVFEKMGAYVFYRNRDCQILTLSRDGDTIRHTLGSNTVIVNGQQKEFENPSVLENGETYIPIEIVSDTLNPDRILYDNQKINIQKYLSFSYLPPNYIYECLLL